MATSTPLNSDISASPKSSSVEQELSSDARQDLCLSYDEAIRELPEFLQPSDEQEQKELAMFLSQVDNLHKPVAGKLSARFIFDFLEKMLTSTSEGPSEVTIPEQLQEVTENIAFEVTNNIISDFDLHNTTISVLNTMQEVSWESKAALIITTFVLTFGDNGLSLCEESKVSINEIQIFPNINDGHKHHLDGSDNLFTIIFQLIDSILKFENLPIAYMISKDPKVRSARTHLIVAIYWIIRIVVAASATHIIKLSSRGYEFDKAISSLWKLPLFWSKKLRDFYNEGHLKDILSRLQNLLKEVVDIEAYNNIKEIIEQKNHDDNLKVLSVLFSSTERDVLPLYDCIRKRKVHLDELKGAHVLLFISGFENIAPEADETKLNEFIDSFDLKSKNEIECKIVWMPLVDEDHSLGCKEATKKFMLKPFLEWFYVAEKLNQVILKYYDHHEKNNFDGWYSIDEPSRISNEVKKLVKDDWRYKGDPIIVVLNPQGNVVNHNAIHLFYSWGIKAFPFTSKRELDLWSGIDLCLSPLVHYKMAWVKYMILW